MMEIYKESISNNLKRLTVSQKTKRFLNIIFSKKYENYKGSFSKRNRLIYHKMQKMNLVNFHK